MKNRKINADIYIYSIIKREKYSFNLITNLTNTVKHTYIYKIKLIFVLAT